MSKRVTVGVQTFDIWASGLSVPMSEMATTLTRYPATGGAGVPADETVTLLDLGGGDIRCAFVPELADYYKLRVQHFGGSAPTFRESNYDYDAHPPGVVSQIPVNEETGSIWSYGTAGEAANIVATLTRFPSDGPSVPADEPVTITDLGNGDYRFTFTPTLVEYYTLTVQHQTTFRQASFAYDVQPGESRAYNEDHEVVDYAQMGSYSNLTTPTLGEVRRFMERRAAQIYARLGDYMDDSPPGPRGYDIVIDTSTDRGRMLEQACAEANAIGAAVDALLAARVQTSEVSERINALNTLWTEKLEQLEGPARQYRERKNEVETHISSGETVEAPVDTTAAALEITEHVQF